MTIFSPTGSFAQQMNAALSPANRPFMSGGVHQVQKALARVNEAQLSLPERGVILGLAQAFAADGRLSAGEAALLTGLIDTAAATPAATGQGRFWPFAQNLGQFGGNQFFGQVLGYFAASLVQQCADNLFRGAAGNLLGQCGANADSARLTLAFGLADLSSLGSAQRSQILTSLGFAAADGHITRFEANAIISQLFSSGGVPANLLPQTTADVHFGGTEVQKFPDGKAVIDLGDGYRLQLDEKHSEMILTNALDGSKTRIWGDPHVDLDGDGKEDAMFKGTTTLNLVNGTKITIDTVPAKNGETYASTLTITRGDQAMVVSGLDQATKGDLQVTQLAGFGQLADLVTPDGTQLYEKPFDSGWLAFNGLWFHEATQADLPR